MRDFARCVRRHPQKRFDDVGSAACVVWDVPKLTLESTRKTIPQVDRRCASDLDAHNPMGIRLLGQASSIRPDTSLFVFDVYP